MRGQVRRVWARAARLWELAKRENASPPQVGVAVGIGALSCCSPLLWAHLLVAVGLASLLRVNRAWAAFASQVPSLFGLLRPFIVFVELELGHRVRMGGWIELDARHAVREAPRMVLDLVVGAGLFGVGVGVVLGVLAYFYARRRGSRSPSPASPAGPASPA
jgi:uncharacterized protein (DUF2062 family)